MHRPAFFTNLYECGSLSHKNCLVETIGTLLMRAEDEIRQTRVGVARPRSISPTSGSITKKVRQSDKHFSFNVNRFFGGSNQHIETLARNEDATHTLRMCSYHAH